MALGFLYVLVKSDFRTLIAGAVVVTVLMVFRTVRRLRDIVTMVFSRSDAYRIYSVPGSYKSNKPYGNQNSGRYKRR